jgi:hypothetical protein
LNLEYLSEFFYFIAFYICLLQIHFFFFAVVKLGRSDRHYVYYRGGSKIFYGSESSQAITFLTLDKVVKRWSIGRIKTVILWEVECVRERI